MAKTKSQKKTSPVKMLEDEITLLASEIKELQRFRTQVASSVHDPRIRGTGASEMVNRHRMVQQDIEKAEGLLSKRTDKLRKEFVREQTAKGVPKDIADVTAAGFVSRLINDVRRNDFDEMANDNAFYRSRTMEK